jgi:hypothetical protein
LRIKPCSDFRCGDYTSLFAVVFAGPGWTWGYLVVRDGPAFEHKNGGPASTRRLWRPVLA